ncbi:MAG: hypothetical protein CMO55_25955 [Verrucomicrobiales bacterium]|nr:hypothetical protein [Verrucomicrobiales bacterium]
MGAWKIAFVVAGLGFLSPIGAEELAVYFPDYRFREGEPVEFYGTTNLILFSAVPKESGEVDFSRISERMIKMGNAAKESNPDLKITVSVGGWGRGNIFGKAVETSESRERFIDSLVGYCEEHSLDGIDIDWEYPKTEREHSDFTLFLTALSEKLHGDNRILTVALSYNRPLSAEAYAAIDYVHVMSYQPWNPPRGSYEEWLREAVKEMLDSGLPADKLVLGMPFYIKEMGGERKAISWKKLVGEDSLAIPSSEFGYSPTGKDICDMRVSMMKEFGLGGVMVWDYGHDSPDPEHSLLKHLSDSIAK